MLDALYQLLGLGYCVIPDSLLDSELEDLRRMASSVMRSDQVAYACSAPFALDFLHPALIGLLAQPRAALDAGLPDLRFYSATLLNSKPGDGVGGWHWDWWAWDAVGLNWPWPPQIGVLYYLCDTSRANGCLRVLPCSHRTRLQWHARIREIGPDTLPGETDVPVHAGDVVILDARVMHSRHANGTAIDRTVVSTWYASQYQLLPESVQSYISRAVPEIMRDQLGPLFPTYPGAELPVAPDYYSVCRCPEPAIAGTITQ